MDFFHLPMLVHVPLCILLAATAAAIWGGLAGFIKAKFGVHEVISTIMLIVTYHLYPCMKKQDHTTFALCPQ